MTIFFLTLRDENILLSTLLTSMVNHLHYTNDVFYDESETCFMYSFSSTVMINIIAKYRAFAVTEMNEKRKAFDSKNRIKEHFHYVLLEGGGAMMTMLMSL